VQLQFHPYLLLFSWVGSMVVVLLAALFPALRATRISVVNALHYE
jgi:ABC-type lipoprotein release transport system permease subunit